MEVAMDLWSWYESFLGYMIAIYMNFFLHILMSQSRQKSVMLAAN